MVHTAAPGKPGTDVSTWPAASNAAQPVAGVPSAHRTLSGPPSADASTTTVTPSVPAHAPSVHVAAATGAAGVTGPPETASVPAATRVYTRASAVRRAVPLRIGSPFVPAARVTDPVPVPTRAVPFRAPVPQSTAADGADTRRGIPARVACGDAYGCGSAPDFDRLPPVRVSRLSPATQVAAGRAAYQAGGRAPGCATGRRRACVAGARATRYVPPRHRSRRARTSGVVPALPPASPVGVAGGREAGTGEAGASPALTRNCERPRPRARMPARAAGPPAGPFRGRARVAREEPSGSGARRRWSACAPRCPTSSARAPARPRDARARARDVRGRGSPVGVRR
ncbi:MAG: hypothetical protein KatS3mg010_0742 [Acidimicrobiia bacterium]|nr:MAG: hypothetical protein KatS3mg010_0742 [Acidimicrobiia bacterium]